MKYRKKPVVIEAITFDEFVEYGRQHTDNIVDGKPWSFEYNGWAVTHETDTCYLIPTLEGTHNFTPEDMLITGVKGEIYPCKKDIFEKTYEAEIDKNGMTFDMALERMKQGTKVKLPSWGGYWYWDPEKETIIMHTKEGKELDIRETDRVEYTLINILSDEWQIADDQNCPELGGVATFNFGEAVKYLKRGMKVARKGWNGKNQYIELASNISYVNPRKDIVNAEHEAIGNRAIAFVGTSGVQLGWLASQADMLAEDWVFAD